METIRIIVKSVVVIIIFSALLEIILPRSDMKRYVNLIIGLFVIIAVLNPFLTVFNKGISLDVLTNEEQGASNDTQSLIQTGKGLADAQRRGAAREYKEKLSRQIAAISGLYQGNQISGVDIDMVDDAASPEFGKVRRVILHLNTTKDAAMLQNQEGAVGDIKIEEIGIGEAEPENTAPPNEGQVDQTALREMIANFYGLSPDQIVIEN
jgi:stage III sporulation protein AF